MASDQVQVLEHEPLCHTALTLNTPNIMVFTICRNIDRVLAQQLHGGTCWQPLERAEVHGRPV